MEAKTIYFKNMNNSGFTNFMNDTDGLLTGKTVITTALATTITQFQADLARLKLSLVAEKGSSFTALRNDADTVRDKVHSGFIYQIKAYMKCNDADKEAAAITLFHAAKQYGLSSLREAKRSNETSLIDGLLDTVSAEKFPAEFALLTEMSNFATALKAANDNYKQLENQQVDQDAQKIDYTTQQVRTDITPKFRAIVNFCEIMSKENVDPQYAQFITELNALIALKQ